MCICALGKRENALKEIGEGGTNCSIFNKCTARAPEAILAPYYWLHNILLVWYCSWHKVWLCYSDGRAKLSETDEAADPPVVVPKAPSSHESASFLHDPIAMWVHLLSATNTEVHPGSCLSLFVWCWCVMYVCFVFLCGMFGGFLVSFCSLSSVILASMLHDICGYCGCFVIQER